MVILIIVGIVALAAGFFGAIAVTAALLALCAPKSRTGAAICFVVAACAVVSAILALCSSTAFFRYSASGPVIWFLVWPTLGCVAVGIVSAAVAVSPIRRRLLAEDSRAATPTI
jgi:uncharacterized membrane protein YfcA